MKKVKPEQFSSDQIKSLIKYASRMGLMKTNCYEIFRRR